MNSSCKLGDDLGQRLGESFCFGSPDQPLCRSIENADAAFGIHPDHPGAGSGQHRFSETTPTIDEIASPDDVVALGAQLLGHFVEGLTELGEVPFRAAGRHLDEEIAGCNHLSGADQAANGATR